MRTSRGRGPSACGPRPTASPRSTTSATERQENEPMIRVLLTARALRAFADGFVAVLLPAYLLAPAARGWEIRVPPALDTGHERQFPLVLAELLALIAEGRRPARLAADTLAKY